ncbi:MAG: hypothetical protein H8E45_10600 [Proteobacteria bacterium]|nr:hypothetical protein [Pseudomonadota bacterium]
MDNKQRKIVIAAGLVLLLNLAVPPWQMRNLSPNSQVTVDMGYSVIFDAPTITRTYLDGSVAQDPTGISINYSKLALQSLVILVVGGLGLFAAKSD